MSTEVCYGFRHEWNQERQRSFYIDLHDVSHWCRLDDCPNRLLETTGPSTHQEVPIEVDTHGTEPVDEVAHIIEETIIEQQPPPQNPPMADPVAQAAPAAPSVSTYQLKERFKKPTEYEGGKSEFQTWRTMVAMYLVGNKELYPNDDDKIGLAMSYTKGEAAHWCALEFERYIVEGWPSWAGFLEDMKKRFVGEHEKDDAWAKLKTLRQSSKEIQTVDKLNELYRECLRATGPISDASIISEYRNTLNKNIEIAILGHQSQPTTLAEWQTRASSVDRALRTVKQTYIMTPSQRPNHQNYTSTPRDPNAMDVDRRFTRLSARELERHRAEGLCFNCHQKGHASRNCPTRNQRPRYDSTTPPRNDYRRDQGNQGRKPNPMYQRAGKQGYSAYRRIEGGMGEGPQIREVEEEDDVAGMDAPGANVRTQEARPYGPQAEVRQVSGRFSTDDRNSTGRAQPETSQYRPYQTRGSPGLHGVRTPGPQHGDPEESIAIAINRIIQGIDDDEVDKVMEQYGGKGF